MRPVTLKRLAWSCGLLLAVLLAVVLVALKLGAVPLSVSDLALNLGRVAIGRSAQLPSEYRLIIFELRLPRILLGILVGAALSVAGAGFQALLRNPLADPYVLGVSSGAALGAIVSLVAAPHLTMLGPLVTPAAVFVGGILIAVGAVYTTAADLNLLLTGEREAMHLGVQVTRVKLVVYIAASMLTGLAVSVSGAIGYVGLLVPHAMRLLFGPDYRLLIPTSALGGAIAVVLADTLARTIAAPTELPVGAMTAMAGAPVFIYLLRRGMR